MLVERLLERLGDAEVLDELTRGGALAAAQQRAAAQLGRVEPDRGGDLVEVLLERPHRLRRRGRADRGAGLGVRVGQDRPRRRRSRSGTARSGASPPSGRRSRPRRSRRRSRGTPRPCGRRACRRRGRRSSARSPCPRGGGRSRRTPRGARGRASPAGRAARASAATWASKWKSHLAPKPPPSSGTTIRTCDSGCPRQWATPERASYGVWLDVWTVTRSPDHCATSACGSIGTPCEESAT